MDADTTGCSYCEAVNDARLNQDACYSDGFYLVPDVMPCIIHNYNLTQEYVDTMNYHDFYHYCDALTAD